MGNSHLWRNRNLRKILFEEVKKYKKGYEFYLGDLGKKHNKSNHAIAAFRREFPHVKRLKVNTGMRGSVWVRI